MKDRGPTRRWSDLPIIASVARLFRGATARAGVSVGVPSSEVKTYRCGTLTYTMGGLVAIFAWLLWGDFCITMMEAVVPTVLPLKLKALAAPNWQLGLIMTTLPGILNMTIAPAVSFKSDRHRGKWGRRIPFIVWTLPFLVLSLILLGCSENISALLQTHMMFLRNVAPATVTISLIGIFMVVFQFFNMFVASVFYYLFNDVVPAQYLSRFVGSFRIVGLLASALYQYFIFRYAETHMREIFVGAALLYCIGFTLMCVMVRESNYPPVAGEDDKAARGLRGIRTFLTECFCDKWYRLFFAWQSIWALSAGIGIFSVFFYREMGLNLEDIGKFNGISLIAAMVATYLAAVFVDRWHPMRVTVYAQVFGASTAFTSWVWIFVTLPGRYYFWLSLSGGLIAVFFYALASVSGFPLQMRIFPKSRFGQFCSAQSLVIALLRLVSGVAAGLFVDGVAWLCRNSGSGPDFVYRFNFIWSGFFTVVSGVFAVWTYANWHRLGADQGYKPPASWSPEKTEATDVVPTIGPQWRWLSLSLWLFHAIMGLTVLGLPALIWWMHQRGAVIAARYYTVLVLPFALAVWMGWIFLERGIRRDMARSVRGEPLRNGIPHHGILMVVSIQYLLAISIWVAQIIVTIKLNMEWECIVFGIANVLTNFSLTAAVLVIWRMERGWSDTLSADVETDASFLPGRGVRARIKALFGKRSNAEVTD